MKRSLILLLVALGTMPVAAAEQNPPQRAAAHAAAARATTATEHLLASGSLADAVRTAAGLRGGAGAARAAASAPGTTLVEVASNLAETLADAGARARDAVRATPDDLALAHRELRALVARPVDASSQAAWDSYEARWTHIHDAIDADEIATQTLRAASALDAALPLLRGFEAPTPIPAVAGCDVLDAAPVLCIGGDGDNTYTREYTLTLDLGGDDLYLTSAGGSIATEPAAAVIDLGGNDTYRSPRGRFAQGSANIGIGILMDESGNDTYEALQGQALAFAGAGLLLDRAGDDRYWMLNQDDPHPNLTPYGSGYAVFGGIGIALDLGGDDNYMMDARPPHEIDTGFGPESGPSVGGFGLGAFGAVGISFDGGGFDIMSATSTSATIDPHDPREVVLRPTALAFGIGIGPFGGFGLHASGDGITRRTIETRAHGPNVDLAFTQGLGFGIGDGIGAVVEGGGSDVYTARAWARADMRLVWDEGCVCRDDVWASSGVPATTAMGYGAIAGIGVLKDLAGSDQYVAEADARTDLHIHDARTTAPASRPTGSAIAGFAQVQAQGSSLMGTGYLDDLGGSDWYVGIARAGSTATATADAGVPSTVAAYPSAATYVQGVGGVGYGELHDRGGFDYYLARSITSSATSPAGVETHTRNNYSQGSVLGLYVGEPSEDAPIAPLGAALLTDVDGGSSDIFVTEPATPTCVGQRGGPSWVDCNGGGFGTNT